MAENYEKLPIITAETVAMGAGVAKSAVVRCFGVLMPMRNLCFGARCLKSFVRFYSGGMSGTVSGLMDFSTYSGAGIGSAVYGGMISAFGYSSMFILWLCISVISVLALAFYRRKMSS